MTSDGTIRVMGGGPAGAAAARMLVQWGHDVRLLTRAAAAESRLAVSLPPSTAKLFDALGVSDAIERAGFIRSTGNTVWWGNETPRVEPFAGGGRGWQVELARLSETLLACAVDAGVRIDDGNVPGFQTRGEIFVLDCTGRAGVTARHSLRVYHDGPRTIALIGEWRTARAWAVPDDSHTIVESYGDGWMWSVPVAPGVRHVAAMVDPQRSGLARARFATGVYVAEIAKTKEFKRLLADATLQGGPWGFAASTYGARTYARDGCLLVGDAGSFIDPLSSAGVKKALASAWVAAVVAHTCVINPSMQAHAMAFYDAREREIEQHYAEESRRFLRDAAHGRHEAFWASRWTDPGERPREADSVRVAFERLKAARAIRLTRALSVTIEPRPFINGHEIALGPHLVTPDHPRGTRHLDGVDLVAVLELAGRHSQVPDLYEGYVQQVGPVPLHDFLLALSTAIARGLIM